MGTSPTLLGFLNAPSKTGAVTTIYRLAIGAAGMTRSRAIETEQ